jgi:hypothetical protein
VIELLLRRQGAGNIEIDLADRRSVVRLRLILSRGEHHPKGCQSRPQRSQARAHMTSTGKALHFHDSADSSSRELTVCAFDQRPPSHYRERDCLLTEAKGGQSRDSRRRPEIVICRPTDRSVQMTNCWPMRATRPGRGIGKRSRGRCGQAASSDRGRVAAGISGRGRRPDADGAGVKEPRACVSIHPSEALSPARAGAV